MERHVFKAEPHLLSPSWGPDPGLFWETMSSQTGAPGEGAWAGNTVTQELRRKFSPTPTTIPTLSVWAEILAQANLASTSTS